ncbi:NodT family efflux transporter outer membrane factor (OMF) lipoprotein [Caulobacter rhizosphaerae]|jgi:NodT family efflux transporter outer membrane factor (OMF) lipoprotein|uniref:NodT family efflux transporter outer membrane factor (OMF) lipoprotein n=1 Tax=Caulobacter rhizosphaerae TaxID=2010972 RepID=A0ABU1MUH8_9CAUL|nr:TolC family protein [Caulobacter rhizosphaerae]MDR6529485.1 NodT family efflux transporter outer membrane factor (OMF) lipoprotein [Caulobacter rhizosphaerae]
MRSAVFPVLSIAASSALFAGCAVGPDYVAPKIASPRVFMGAKAVEARSAAPATSASTDAWWRGFNDPVLDRLVDRALAQNLDLAQAGARVAQARAGVRAATAALLPSASVQASGAKVHASTQTPTGRLLAATPNFDREGELYEGDLVAGWELDVFGGGRRDREAALAQYRAAEAGVAAARLAVAAQTADTYVLVRGLQERLAIARGQVETQTRLVETVHLQREQGVAADLQLQQAVGALEQTRASLPVLEEGLEAALNAMDVIQGAQPGTYRAELATVTAIPTAPGLADAGGPAELLRRRPDLVVAEQRLRASNAQVGSAISQYFPKFSLSGLVGTATTSSSALFEGPANQAQGVLGLRWRLFDFGRVGAEVAAARGQKAEALAAYQQSVLRATEDVENAFSSLVKRESQERTLAAGEASLAKARAASQAAYGGGVVSLIEVLDADARLLAVRDARAQARTEAARAAIRSFQALGGGWRDPSGADAG